MSESVLRRTRNRFKKVVDVFWILPKAFSRNLRFLRTRSSSFFGLHFVLLLFVLDLSSCGAPGLDIHTAEGKAAILDATRLALTDENCGAAIAAIEPLYNSDKTDNEVRLLRASAHACNAGVNFFSTLSSLVGSSLGGPGFWTKMTELFPSNSLDSKLDSAWFTLDSLHSVILPGTVIPSSQQINAGSNNVGSTQYSHRVTDANAYLIFAAMATIGISQNRFGNPDSTTYEKGNDLPWSTTALMTESGCGYAGSVINMLDGIQAVSTEVSGSLSTTLAEIANSFSVGISTACVFGCQGFDWDGTPAFDPGCTYGASECVPCPLALRTRTSCETAGSQASCAAAGIVRFINNSPTGWQGP